MTREEAKDKMLTESVQYKNGLRTVALRKINNFIDKIFNEHEALQQRSCESCRHWDFIEQGHFKKCFNGKGNVSSTKGDFCCNRYEAKEQ